MKTLFRFRCPILTFLLLTASFFKSNASDYLQVRFSSPSTVATATVSGDSILLDFNDPALDAIFSGYKIIGFNQDYPSVSKFPGDSIAEVLGRVYAIRDSAKLSSLIPLLTSANSADLDNFYLANNEVVELSDPNDYYNVTSGSGWPTASQHLDLINAKGAWNITKGLSCIKVGVIDFNFQNHSDLDGNVIFLPPTNAVISTPNSSISHGNAVAGMVAAVTNNNMGIASLGYNLKMRYYATFPYNNTTSDPFYDVSLNAILDAIGDGCQVVNCS
jgi:hypothetical protein